MFASRRRAIRRAVLRAHGRICWICKQPFIANEKITMDHVKPVKYGGKFEPSNLRPAHRDCNEHRGHGPPPRTSLLASDDTGKGGTP